MSRLIRGLASILALALLVTGAHAQDKKEQGFRLEGSRDSNSWESFIALRLAGNKPAEIRHFVVIDAANSVFGVPLKNSVYGENADRISGLGKIPVIGQLFGDRPDREAFAKGKEIGSVYLFGNAMMVTLNPRIMEILNSSATELGIDEKVLDEMLEQALREGIKSPRLQTQVASSDGKTLVLGGLRVANRGVLFDIRSDQVVRDDPKAGVPILGKIPTLSSLFRNKVGDAYRDSDRLMILISPTVLRGEYER